MNEQAQRIAIAKVCGLRIELRTRKMSGTPYWVVLGPNGMVVSSPAPDYLHDLNAMHWAEEAGVIEAFHANGKTWHDYDAWLVRITGHERPIDANASERAEAFLRTLGLYQE